MTDRLTDNEPFPAGERERLASDAADLTKRQPVDDHVDLGAGAEEPVGDDNIREGRVGGVMGGPRQQQGEGGGG